MQKIWMNCTKALVICTVAGVVAGGWTLHRMAQKAEAAKWQEVQARPYMAAKGEMPDQSLNILRSSKGAYSEEPRYKTSPGQLAAPMSNAPQSEEAPLPSDYQDSLTDFANKQAGLTQEEKDRLAKEDALSAPIYEELNAINPQIEAATARVLQGAQWAFEERAKLFDTHTDLWLKVETISNEEQKSAKTYIEHIQASKNLSAQEKEVLVKLQQRIDELDKAIEGYYAQAEEENAQLQRRADDLVAQLQNIHDKNRDIWEKIYGE